MSSDQALQSAYQLQRAGRLDEAEALYQRHLAAHPNDPRALHALGTLLLQRRQPDRAVEPLGRAAGLAPNSPDAHFALADALRFCERFAEAEQAYRKSIALRPLFPPAHNGLGLALVRQNKPESAILSWQRAIQLRQQYAEAYSNVGAALSSQKKHTEAAAALRRAIEIDPAFAAAHNNLANVLNDLEDFDGAIAHWQKAVELQPAYFDALVNLARALQNRGDDQDALQLLDRAVQMRPGDADARFLRGLCLLRRGRLAEGFADYRFRLKLATLPLGGRSIARPAWEGDDISGKTILVHTEQGLGDAIQFARYATVLAQGGARVLLECPAELVALLRTVPGVASAFAGGGEAPAFDEHIRLLELPRVLGTTLESIPAQVPYVLPPPERVAAWKDILRDETKGRRVGLVWSGNPKHSNDRNRSIPLRLLDPLADVEDCTFFSLQKGPAAGQIADSTLRLRPIDHTARLGDFVETAALIANLDLVIAVDTSVAHLAGAMAKPVWLLLPQVPDWRWLTDRADSPWYPTMRLFRQPSAGDWKSLVQAVRNELSTKDAKVTK